MLEVCIDSLESALNAIHGGAEELEVCSSLVEGGLTPSSGLVKEIINMVNNISSKRSIHSSCSENCCRNIIQKPKVNVMIRCRGGSDFSYNQLEMETMLADIDVFKLMGVDRFVFGALTNELKIDEDCCSKIVIRALPVPVTFHRAFDICKDPIVSLNKVIDLGFNRVLTSGQKESAGDPEAIKLIQSLLTLFGDKIEIMPGAGVNADNVKSFKDLGCKIVHSSCKTKRFLPIIDHLSMGSNESEVLFVTDENIVRKMKELLCS